jgi:hypothetical protein
MSSQGSAYGPFRRALDRGNTLQAMSAAAELSHVGLADALELVLLLGRDGAGTKFERAALRWHARYCRNTHTAALGDGDRDEPRAAPTNRKREPITYVA